MHEVINAVIIDDKIEDIHSVSLALSSKGIATLPVHYQSPSQAYLACEATSKASPRIIITDIQMNHGGLNPSKTDLTNVAECIYRIVSNTSGPYVVLAWTSIPNAFSELKTRVETFLERKKIRLPIYFGSISKEECSVSTVDGCSSELVFEKFKAALENQKQIRALMHWENSILKAANNTVNALVGATDDDLEKVLYSLAKESAGENLEGNEAFAINESLIYVLKDNLSYLSSEDKSNDVWNEAFIGGRSDITEDSKHKLNSMMHFDSNIDSRTICPGDIWQINKEESFFKMFSSESFVQNKIKEFRQEFYKNSNVEGDKLVCMEISPACDFSNKKKIFKSLVLGVLIPKGNLSNATKDRLKKEESFLSIKIEHKNKMYIFVISCKYSIILTDKKIASLERAFKGEYCIKKIFRIRENILQSWIHKISAYNSRIGTVSFN